jgi:lysophospholipase L1-like esterase
MSPFGLSGRAGSVTTVSERVVLCYGDSNTYGWDSETGGRFPPEVRWPGVLAAELGSGWRVVEEGLGGRTTVHDDPLMPHRNGLTYLAPCLCSHAPLDAVVLFLGTNDLKPRFGLPAGDVARGIGVLIEHVLASGAGPDWRAPSVVVLGLPRLGRFDAADEQFDGVAAKWERLPGLLRRMTEELGVGFVDLGDTTAYSDVDARHLDRAGHAAVGRAAAHAVRRS